jgi:queuosine precursor transporter
MINDKTASLALNHPYKHLWILLLSFTMVISISNWYDSRLVSIFGIIISPGALTFPISFLLSDIITEVYGYKLARRAIRTAFLFNILFLIFGQIVIHLPSPSVAAENNAAFNKLLTMNNWIVGGSLCSYLISEPLNSYLVAKLKNHFNGKYIGIRFIISTIFSVFIGSTLFILIAFHNVLDLPTLLLMVLHSWVIKVSIEIIGLPFSIRFAKWLKKSEQLDIYDKKTNFNPFKLDVTYDQSNNHFSKLRD